MIPLSTPNFGLRELFAVNTEILRNQIAIGPALNSFENQLKKLTNFKYSVAVSNGTSALHLVLLSLKIDSFSFFIAPTMTFAGSVFPFNYVTKSGILLDVEKEYLNLDLNLLEITLKRKRRSFKGKIVTLGVDLYGTPQNYPELKKLCDKYDSIFIVDAAESLGSSHLTADLPNYCDAAIVSFNGNKIITTGGGGAILSNNKKIVENSRFLANQAKSKKDYYFHKETGYNFRMSNIQAAVGVRQLQKMKKFCLRKNEINNNYIKGLTLSNQFSVIKNPPWGISNHWLNILRMDHKTKIYRTNLKNFLRGRGIETRYLWNPLHKQPAFKHLQVLENGTAIHAFETSLCLPSSTNLSKKQQKYVIKAICEYVLGNN